MLLGIFTDFTRIKIPYIYIFTPKFFIFLKNTYFAPKYFFAPKLFFFLKNTYFTPKNTDFAPKYFFALKNTYFALKKYLFCS